MPSYQLETQIVNVVEGSGAPAAGGTSGKPTGARDFRHEFTKVFSGNPSLFRPAPQGRKLCAMDKAAPNQSIAASARLVQRELLMLKKSAAAASAEADAQRAFEERESIPSLPPRHSRFVAALPALETDASTPTSLCTPT